MTNSAAAAARAEKEKEAAAESPARAALRRQLQNLADYYSDMISMQDGVVCYDAPLERHFPHLDWERLLTLYGESPDDWNYIIAGYMAGVTEAELNPPEAPFEKLKPPLRCIGQSWDMLSGQLRPVYNRDPEPGEIPPEPAAAD